MKPMNDATSALLRAIRARFEDVTITIEEIRSRSWASATFAGARHELAFRIEGERAHAVADTFLADLESAEFNLRGHILADIGLVSDARPDDGRSVSIGLEALTVEDD